MWPLLSSRVPAWTLLALLAPAARRALRRASDNAQQHDPQAPRAQLLRKADSLLPRRRGAVPAPTDTRSHIRRFHSTIS